MTHPCNSAIAAAIALSLGLGLSACAGQSTVNRSLDSVKQPVVQSSSYALDLAAGAGGLPLAEQQRLADWFEALHVSYGDTVALAGPAPSDAVRQDINAIAARRGVSLGEAAGTVGFVANTGATGTVRVVISRSSAHVPGCPDWSDRFESSLQNGIGSNYGCAINGNLAAMVADPAHLIEGAQDTGQTVVMTSNKAIATYRTLPTTGAAGLPEVSTSED